MFTEVLSPNVIQDILSSIEEENERKKQIELCITSIIDGFKISTLRCPKGLVFDGYIKDWFQMEYRNLALNVFCENFAKHYKQIVDIYGVDNCRKIPFDINANGFCDVEIM